MQAGFRAGAEFADDCLLYTSHSDWAFRPQLSDRELTGMAQSASQKEQKVLEALNENWQAEMRGFHTYNTLAERDDDSIRRKTLRHIAEAEAQHAALWAKRIRELGAELPKYDGKATGLSLIHI